MLYAVHGTTPLLHCNTSAAQARVWPSGARFTFEYWAISCYWAISGDCPVLGDRQRQEIGQYCTWKLTAPPTTKISQKQSGFSIGALLTTGTLLVRG